MWKTAAVVALLLAAHVPAASADIVVMTSAECERLIPNQTPHQVLSQGECIAHFLERKPVPFVFHENVVGSTLYRLVFGDLRLWALAVLGLVLGSATLWLMRRRRRFA